MFVYNADSVHLLNDSISINVAFFHLVFVLPQYLCSCAVVTCDVQLICILMEIITLSLMISTWFRFSLFIWLSVWHYFDSNFVVFYQVYSQFWLRMSSTTKKKYLLMVEKVFKLHRFIISHRLFVNEMRYRFEMCLNKSFEIMKQHEFSEDMSIKIVTTWNQQVVTSRSKMYLPISRFSGDWWRWNDNDHVTVWN